MLRSVIKQTEAARAIVCRAPVRISFFGGGTDYPQWFERRGGAVLSTTLRKYCYAVGSTSNEYLEQKRELWLSMVDRTQDREKHSLVVKILEHLKLPGEFVMRTGCEISQGSGLGTSAAFIVSVLGCVYNLLGIDFSREKLAIDAIGLERDILKRAVGNQDQIAASHGGLNHITFTREGKSEVRRLTVAPSRIEELQSCLRIVHTGSTRNSADIARTYTLERPESVAALTSISSMVTRAVEIIVGNEDLTAFGALLDESWREKKKLSRFISNQAVDEIYHTAKAEGAIGGKLLGAGGGGYLLLFAPPSAHERIQRRLGGLRLEAVLLDTLGFQSWTI
jgi:D-glycero-alpha-D-manno-heptose-7-phosphate kinase